LLRQLEDEGFMSDTILVSGRTVSGITVSAGTTLDVEAGGVAVDTIVTDGGYETVVSGGVTSDTTVRAGGSDIVSAGGTAFATTVDDAGTLIVSGGGTALGTRANPGAVVSVTSRVVAGQVVSGLVIGPDTLLEVTSGGLAIATTIAPGGVETVLAGGSASTTTVASGGSFIVFAGGSAAATIVAEGGQAAITSVYVLSGGIARGTTVLSGGSAVVSAGGTDLGTVVSAGGYETISGTSDNAVIEGFVRVAGGVVSGATVAGGLMADADGAVVRDTTIAPGGLVTLAEGSAASGAIVFEGDGTLAIQGGIMPFAVLSHFAAGDTLDLIGLPFARGGTAVIEDGVLIVSEGGEAKVLPLAGDYAGADFRTAPDGVDLDGDSGTLVTVSDVRCFAAGTLIETDRGPVAVEGLTLGDRVMTIDGEAEPIVWIGMRRVDCGRHAEPARVWPVRIAAHAFGPGRPARDLFLSPDHAIFAEGVLIPVKHLINGRGIAQRAVDAVTYFHVELPGHGVLLAEGLPVESYLDTGDRAAFADGMLVRDVLGYAPLRVMGPVVDRVRAANLLCLAERGPHAAQRPHARALAP
jgi:autotransporter passenger strand-loop-strand repeat protein